MNTVNAAIYTRVSTEEQAADGYGLKSQLEKCEAMATVKGWPVVARFTDEGISGTKDETGRPGLQQLTEAVASGEVQAVIVNSLDRIGRSTRLVLRIVENINNEGAELVSCKESLDTSSPTGRFVLRMFASLAELDRDQIVERTTSGRNARGKIDGERGGRVPMGYTRVFADGKSTGNVIINEAEAATVRTIFAMRDNGDTLNTIAAALNDAGTVTRRGKQFHASSVRSILNNADKYEGGNRGESENTFPAILK